MNNQSVAATLIDKALELIGRDGDNPRARWLLTAAVEMGEKERDYLSVETAHHFLTHPA